MQEILGQIFTYIWGVWRHRWAALAVAWVVAIVGWSLVWKIPDVYVASARVYVDTNSVLRPLLKGLAVEPDIEERISMMSRTLISRPNLEKLMRMTDLDLQAETDEERNEMLVNLGESISLTGSIDNATLYSISVRDTDPEVAKRVAQSLITVFIESSLKGKRAYNSGAEDFLNDQIVESEARLAAAEDRLALFKQENMEVLPGSDGDYYAKLQMAKQDLNRAKLLLRELENRQGALQRQLDGEEPVFLSGSVSGQGGDSALDSRISSMRASLDSLTIRYTDKHPEVVQLSALIEELEAEKEAQRALAREAGSTGEATGLSNSPIYQGMRSMLSETEANIAELQVRVEEYERRVAELNARVNSIPRVEVELRQLDRDYGVISAQHQELLARRESARLSEDIEQTASDVNFRVIDPPYVPLEASEPNKLLLNGAVLFVAVAVGIGVSLLISLISPVVSDARTLVDITGLPLLGAVTVNLLPERKRQEMIQLIAFTSLSVGLFIVFIGMSLGQSGLWSA